MYDASLYTLIGIPNLSTACAVNAHLATSTQMTEILTWFSFICSWLRMVHQPMDGEVMVCKPRCSSNDCLYVDSRVSRHSLQESSSPALFNIVYHTRGSQTSVNWRMVSPVSTSLRCPGTPPTMTSTLDFLFPTPSAPPSPLSPSHGSGISPQSTGALQKVLKDNHERWHIFFNERHFHKFVPYHTPLSGQLTCI